MCGAGRLAEQARSPRGWRWRALLVALLFASLGGSAVAQCVVPDNLDLAPPPCCAVTQANLPKFPAFQHAAKSICWKDCQVSQVGGYFAAWTPPVAGPIPSSGAIPCGMFISHLFLFVGSGLHFRGPMQLIYARTWLENGPGTQYQVWRFLVNGDLEALPAAGSPPCPVPPCAASFKNRAHFTGYLDYARDCTNGTFSTAWMLTHTCDFIDHAPGFPRGGTFHPDRAYTFVGPGAGFVPGPIQPIEGGGAALEDSRRIQLPGILPPVGAAQCAFEEPLLAGSLTPQLQFCLCTSSSGPNQWVQSDLFLASGCGTVLQAIPGWFPPGFLSMGIGNWTNPLVYPGQEVVRWTVGGYDDFAPCLVTSRPQVFYGASTIGGFPAFEIYAGGVGQALPSTFVDQCDSLQPQTQAVIMNVRFISDHVLNLNF
jgi:hypothetical protein